MKTDIKKFAKVISYKFISCACCYELTLSNKKKVWAKELFYGLSALKDYDPGHIAIFQENKFEVMYFVFYDSTFEVTKQKESKVFRWSFRNYIDKENDVEKYKRYQAALKFMKNCCAPEKHDDIKTLLHNNVLNVKISAKSKLESIVINAENNKYCTPEIFRIANENEERVFIVFENNTYSVFNMEEYHLYKLNKRKQAVN